MASPEDHWLADWSDGGIYALVIGIIIASFILILVISISKYKYCNNTSNKVENDHPTEMVMVPQTSSPQQMEQPQPQPVQVVQQQVVVMQQPAVQQPLQQPDDMDDTQQPQQQIVYNTVPQQQQVVVIQQPIVQVQQPVVHAPIAIIAMDQQKNLSLKSKGALYCDLLFAALFFVLGIVDAASSLILAREYVGGVQCTLYEERVDLGLASLGSTMIGLTFLGLMMGAFDIYWTVEQYFIDKTCLFDNKYNNHNAYYGTLLGALTLIFLDISIMWIQMDAGFTTGSRTSAWKQSFYLSFVTVFVVSVKGMYDARKVIGQHCCKSLPFLLNCLACCPVNCCLITTVLMFSGAISLGSHGIVIVNDVVLANTFGVEVDRIDFEIDDKLFDFNCTQIIKTSCWSFAASCSKYVTECEFVCTSNCGSCSTVYFSGVAENSCDLRQCDTTDVEVCYTQCNGN